MKQVTPYSGFELGPIRPPSESQSLMLRVTRNCPWNQCTFCGLYKGKSFSIRPVSHVKKDIDAIRACADHLLGAMDNDGDIPSFLGNLPAEEQQLYYTVLYWIQNGMESVFLQDANSLIIKPEEMIEILFYLRKAFPEIKRITSYSRSHTIARISDEDLARIADAGLNRIHIGMESAADEVLTFVKKGVDKKTHILAGQKVKRSGIELSEYFMPGLGGDALSMIHARETADALNQINPDFIRIRTLGIPRDLELYKDVASGSFTKLGDVASARELLFLLESLEGVSSTIKSDHILNLLQEVEGVLPHEASAITAPLKEFLDMSEGEQVLFMAGRRTGIFSSLADLNDHWLRTRAEQVVERYHLTPETIDAFTAEQMTQFI